MYKEKFYITISRQFGSLGRSIAREMSEILEIPYYDRDIVEKTAAEMNLTISQVSENDEESGNFKFARSALPLGNVSTDKQDAVFAAQQQVILNFADKGPAIFVGRCADYILRDQKYCLNIFIYASKKARYLNCTNTLRMKPDEAKKMIEKVDKARDKYWMRYTKHKPGDPDYRHIMIDSSVFGVSGTANLLADVAKKYFEELIITEE